MNKNNNKNNPVTDRSSGVRSMLLGNAYTLVAILLFAANIPVVKLLIPRWMNVDGVTIVRIVGGCLLFGVASLFVKRDPLEKSDFWRVFLGGGITVFLFIYLLNFALKYGNPIDVSIIMTLPPVYVLIYQMIFKHRRPSWLEVAGILIAFAGAVIVIAGGQQTRHAPDPLLGDLIAILCGLAYMLYLLILEKPTHKYKPVPMLKWVFLGASIPCLFICPWGMTSAPILHTQAEFMPWFWTIFLMAGPSFLAYLLINPAIKLIGSELVAIYQYFMPVATTIIVVLMGEARFQWIEGVAIVMIILGMILTDYANHSSLNRSRTGNANSKSSPS